MGDYNNIESYAMAELLRLVKEKVINETEVRELIKLIEEHAILRKANAFNQSLLDAFYKWFNSLGVEEEISKKRDTSPIYETGSHAPAMYIERRRYCFPDIVLGASIDNNLLLSISKAKNIIESCELCHGGNGTVMYCGEPVYVCPKCGRILR